MQKILVSITFVVCFVCVNTNLNAKIKDKAFYDAKSFMFQLKFEQVDSCISEIKFQPVKSYLKLYSAFVSEMIVGCNNYKKYNQLYEEEVAYITCGNEEAAIYPLFLSELYLQRGIIEYKNGNTLKSISYFSKSYSYWKDSDELSDVSDYSLKLRGIFNLLLGNLPQPYNQVVSWFGFKGDTEQGFCCLADYLKKQQLEQGDYFEALLYLGFSFLKFGDDNDDIKDFITLYSSAGLPELIKSIVVRCANKIHHPNLCENILKDYASYPPLIYLQGKYQVQIGSITSEKTLSRFLATENRNQFKSDAYRYLSWNALLRGDRERFRQYQDSIRLQGSFPTSEDKQAYYESKLNKIPDVVLLKSRLLFDNGQFELVINILKDRGSYKTKEEKLECYYRLGRCYQFLLKDVMALSCYEKAVEMGDVSKRYFGSYAALYASEICLSEGNVARGKYFLEKADELNNGEYKYDISLKIKALEKLF